MKKTFLMSLFLMSILSFAQSIDSTQINKKTIRFDRFFLDTLKDEGSTNLSFKISPVLKQDDFFSIYNSLTMYNDNYKIDIDNSLYLYTNSTKVLENDFRYNKIDSFNPNGAVDFGSGMVLGVFNFLLGKIQK